MEGVDAAGDFGGTPSDTEGAPFYDFNSDDGPPAYEHPGHVELLQGGQYVKVVLRPGVGPDFPGPGALLTGDQVPCASDLERLCLADAVERVSSFTADLRPGGVEKQWGATTAMPPEWIKLPVPGVTFFRDASWETLPTAVEIAVRNMRRGEVSLVCSLDGGGCTATVIGKALTSGESDRSVSKLTLSHAPPYNERPRLCDGVRFRLWVEAARSGGAPGAGVAGAPRSASTVPAAGEAAAAAAVGADAAPGAAIAKKAAARAGAAGVAAFGDFAASAAAEAVAVAGAATTAVPPPLLFETAGSISADDSLPPALRTALTSMRREELALFVTPFAAAATAEAIRRLAAPGGAVPPAAPAAAGGAAPADTVPENTSAATDGGSAGAAAERAFLQQQQQQAIRPTAAEAEPAQCAAPAGGVRLVGSSPHCREVPAAPDAAQPAARAAGAPGPAGCDTASNSNFEFRVELVDVFREEAVLVGGARVALRTVQPRWPGVRQQLVFERGCTALAWLRAGTSGDAPGRHAPVALFSWRIGAGTAPRWLDAVVIDGGLKCGQQVVCTLPPPTAEPAKPGAAAQPARRAEPTSPAEPISPASPAFPASAFSASPGFPPLLSSPNGPTVSSGSTACSASPGRNGASVSSTFPAERGSAVSANCHAVNRGQPENSKSELPELAAANPPASIGVQFGKKGAFAGMTAAPAALPKKVSASLWKWDEPLVTCSNDPVFFFGRCSAGGGRGAEGGCGAESGCGAGGAGSCCSAGGACAASCARAVEPAAHAPRILFCNSDFSSPLNADQRASAILERFLSEKHNVAWSARVAFAEQTQELSKWWEAASCPIDGKRAAGYGGSGWGAEFFPPAADRRVTVELVELLSRDAAPWIVSEAERLEAARVARALGNLALQKNAFDEARRYYTADGLHILSFCEAAAAATAAEKRSLRNNVAISFSKESRFREAIDAAKAALAEDGNNAKAAVIAVRCALRLEDFPAAAFFLEKARTASAGGTGDLAAVLRHLGAGLETARGTTARRADAALRRGLLRLFAPAEKVH